MADESQDTNEPVNDTADLRALVGSMLGADQVQTMDEGSLRALSTVLLERMMFARQAGYSFHGARDLYEILGYNRLLSYREYRARYMRGGIAKRVVDAYPTAVWRAGAEVYEDEDASTDTAFEKEWKDLEAQLGVWSRFQRAHILATLSTYSVLLIGATGELQTELPRGAPGKLLYLQPYSGGGGPSGGDNQDNRGRAMNADVTIASFDIDPASKRFGQPQTYQIRRTAIQTPESQRTVHWSRVIHVADGLLGDEVYGTPAMEAVWNLLDDLDKVTGGGAEAFWLRANQGLHLDVDKTMALAPGATPAQGTKALPGLTNDQRKALADKAELLQHQMQRVMVTRGVTATQLGSDVADFSGAADAIITQIAGTKAIPKRILVGSEMGQLASGQDKDNWNTQVQDKRTSWAFPGLVKLFVDRLVDYGYLSKPKMYAVEWPVIEDLTQDEKVKLQLDMATVNKTQEAVVYTESEIREVTGREPLSDADANDGLSEMQKAMIATKLALTNKEMGITVYTDDEIRKMAHGLEPLKDSEKVPIGAPEKISVGAPPKLGADGLPVDPPQVPVAQPLLAMQLAALEAAIEHDDVNEITRILGMSAAPIPLTLEAARAPHVTVNMPEPLPAEPPTVVVNVPRAAAEPRVVARRVEFDAEGKMTRLVNEFEEPKVYDADTYH